MEQYINLAGLPNWFEWNPTTEEGRTFDHVVTRSDGRPYTANGVDPLTWHTTNEGRSFITFRVDGEFINLYKHELIWMAYYMRPIPDGCVIHHIDFNKDNNDPNNLQLLTKEEHWKIHAEERSKAVIAVDKKNRIVLRFVSTAEARKNGYDQSAVSKACRGCFNREGNHKYKGLWWYYESDWLALQEQQEHPQQQPTQQLAEPIVQVDTDEQLYFSAD